MYTASTTGVTPTVNSTALMSSSGDLDKMAFLRLLITELSNQDPMSPMEDKEFIAQLAQFSSLEQMTSLNTSVESLATSLGSYTHSASAISMIGKTVLATDPDSTDDSACIGTVQSVLFDEDGVYLRVNVVTTDGDTQTTTLKNIPLANVLGVQ